MHVVQADLFVGCIAIVLDLVGCKQKQIVAGGSIQVVVIFGIARVDGEAISPDRHEIGNARRDVKDSQGIAISGEAKLGYVVIGGSADKPDALFKERVHGKVKQKVCPAGKLQ